MNEIIKAMKERRSIRKFKAELPSKADLGIEGEWEGIGHCAVGYMDVDLPKPAPRKEDALSGRNKCTTPLCTPATCFL